MSNQGLSYGKSRIFRGVLISAGCLSGKKSITMKEIIKHSFEVQGRMVNISQHWFYPKILRNAKKGGRPVFVKMHFYSTYLKRILEAGDSTREVLTTIKVAPKFKDGKLSDIIINLYPERHGAKSQFNLRFIVTNNGKAIAVPHALEKIYFKPRTG